MLSLFDNGLPRWIVGALVAFFVFILSVQVDQSWLTMAITIFLVSRVFIRLISRFTLVGGALLLVGGLTSLALGVSALHDLIGLSASADLLVLAVVALPLTVLAFHPRVLPQSSPVPELLLSLFGLLLIWITSRITIVSSLRILSNGYDNQQHLSLILFFRDSPQFFIPVVKPNPFAPDSILGIWLRVLGFVEADLRVILAAQVLLTVLIPMTVFLGLAFSILHFFHRKTLAVTAIIGASALIFTGNPSHLWGSGYLTSNFGLWALVMLYCYLFLENQPNSVLVSLACLVIVAFAYPLFFPFWWIASVASLLRSRSDFVSDETCALTNRRRHRQILIALIATPLLLVLGALLTSNQISEQLALSGGIEPLGHPGAIALAAGVIVGAAMSINRLHYGLLLVSVIVTLYVVGLATYTMRKVNYVSYYPTKIGLSGAVLLTVVAVVIFGASVNQTEQTKVHRRATTFASFVAFGVTVAPMSSLWWSSSSFKQTYMGSGTAFAKGLISGSVGSFDSTLVLAAYQKSQETGRPVVFLEPADSNTLMSYWVNNMTRQTSFRVYGAWFQAVRSINSQDYEGAALRIQDQSLLPVALSLDMVNAIRLAGADEVCLWEPTELVCSSK